MNTDPPQSLGRVEYQRLLEFIADQPLGILLTYEMVEDATGVQMRSKAGRARLRRAIERNDRGFLVVPNVGYQLDSPQLATTIAGVQLIGVVNKSNKANIRVRRQLRRFIQALPPEEKTQLIFVDAQVAAIRLAASPLLAAFLDKSTSSHSIRVVPLRFQMSKESERPMFSIIMRFHNPTAALALRQQGRVVTLRPTTSEWSGRVRAQFLTGEEIQAYRTYLGPGTRENMEKYVGLSGFLTTDDWLAAYRTLNGNRWSSGSLFLVELMPEEVSV